MSGSKGQNEIMAQRDFSRAITALYLELNESIVNDIREKANAALRAAKVEGLREAQQEARFGVMELRAAYEKRGGNVLKYSLDALQDFADILESRITELDARAAQIEEGE